MKFQNYRKIIFIIGLVCTITSWISSSLNIFPFFINQGLVLLVIVLGGTPIIYSALKAVYSLNFRVDFLASIAIVASVIVGEYIASAIVVLMLSGGEILEEYASEKATLAIEKLVQTIPGQARVRRNGNEIIIPIEEVQLGDVAIIKSGEKIPVDGIVIRGSGSVNQSSITGESIPDTKTVNDPVFGNTVLEIGVLEVQVNRVGEDTTFSQIIKLVKEAKTRKAPIERIADRYSQLFSPIILLIAGLVFLITADVFRVITILLIACPCALTIATPTAVIAAIGNAARKGIIIRGGIVLEQTAKVNMLVIDKTGTLTTGTPEVVFIKGTNGRKESEVLFLAALAERYSEHSLAKAVMKKANMIGVDLTDPSDFAIIPGQGVVTKYNGKDIAVGNRVLIDSAGIRIDESSEKYVTMLENEGKSVLLVAENQEVIGVIGVADSLRENIPKTIQKLKASGIKKIEMLTGDTSQVAQNIGKQAGIDEINSGLLPKDKLEYVERFRTNYSVAMVGDGINDAPALASADVGIAMGGIGTDIAIETAGIVLTNDDLSKVPEVISLSKKTIKVIKQNIVLALVVNILGILFSTIGILNPIIASFIHESNALFVVLNSIRLINYNK